MFSRFQFKLTSAGARWLCSLARVPGSGALRTAGNVMEYATMLAQMRQLTSIDVPLLKESLRCSLTIQRSKALIDNADEMISAIKAA